METRLSAETGDTLRRHRLPWWAKPLGLLVFAVVVWFGGGALLALARERWLHHIPALALREIPVARDGVITADEIRRLAGIELGCNILTVDPYAVRQRLLRHPRIEEARLELEFPSTLRISVRERVPVARVMLPPLGGTQSFLLVDDLGRVMAPFERGRAPVEIIQAEAALPMLAGITAVGIAPGHQMENPNVLAALRFLALFDAAPIAAEADVTSVDVAVPGLLTVLTSRGAQITLVPDRFEHQLQQWFGVHLRSLELRRAIGTLDLSVANNPPLRWIDFSPSTNEPPVRPVRPKRRPPQRRHV